MNAVTNAGPLMALAKLGVLDLLFRLYQPVWLSWAVHDEVVLHGIEKGFPDALVVQMAVRRGQLAVVNLAESQLSTAILDLPLGIGEKQTIALAQRNRADLVLLDDAQARQAAQSFGLRVKGTLGVITQATRAQHIDQTEAISLIESILERDDIWIAEELCRRVMTGLQKQNTRK